MMRLIQMNKHPISLMSYGVFLFVVILIESGFVVFAGTVANESKAKDTDHNGCGLGDGELLCGWIVGEWPEIGKCTAYGVDDEAVVVNDGVKVIMCGLQL